MEEVTGTSVCAVVVRLSCLIYFYFFKMIMASGGLFPPVIDISTFSNPLKDVSSTCGFNNEKMIFCKSKFNWNSLTTCEKASCLFGCCEICGSSQPKFIDLDKDARAVDGVYVSADRRPGSLFSSTGSKKFENGYLLYDLAPDEQTSNFTFSTWIHQDELNTGVLIERESDFTVIASKYTLHLKYVTKAVPQLLNEIPFGNIILNEGTWCHLALVLSQQEVSLFINGVLIRTATLEGILNKEGRIIRIGQSPGSERNQYKGLMQDIKYYTRGISNREVSESMNGTLQSIPYTQCRCPETYPKLSPTNIFFCTKNGASSTTNLVPRLSSTSFPPEYMLDRSLSSFWLSELVEEAQIEFDLKYAKLQIIVVSLTFYSPMPKGIKIERSLNFGTTFMPWQFFSTDCKSIFNMQPNGHLPEADSVNCIQTSNPISTSEFINFNPYEPGPENRPQRPFGEKGCNNFYCSQKLLEFVQATNIRITFKQHALVKNDLHKYFGVRRIIIGVKCDCYGHARTCTFDNSNDPNRKYRCDCHPDTHTEGDQCERCKPLYMDKLFKRGDATNLNPCRKCVCHNHADSCYYDPRLDPFPKDRGSSGGGVCRECKHDTMGRHCEVCKDHFYRPQGKPLDAEDVCTPCMCVGPGIIMQDSVCQKDDSTPGIQAGQCTCKKYVTGRSCELCKEGYFDLQVFNTDGCRECNCNTDGTLGNAAGCGMSTGQCLCKKNVMGVKCTTCKKNYYGLSREYPLGCRPCECNPTGTHMGTICEPVSGQCHCKGKFTGRACDRCEVGFFGQFCEPCVCNVEGTVKGKDKQCNGNSGQCKCLEHVTGVSCDKCKEGFFRLSKANPSGCIPCNCSDIGTIGNRGACSENGTCTCKSSVTGARCDACVVGTYDLSARNPEGCYRCNCYPKGTQTGDQLPQDKLPCTATGQCTCVANVHGLRCEQCMDHSFWNPSGQGCLPCRCDTKGSLSLYCNETGRCRCHTDRGVGGMKCNHCLSGFFKFINGRCSPCNCASAGTIGSNCDGSGRCTQCKQNVVGFKCDKCKPGTIHLRIDNPYGCSGVPSEQGPPRAINTTSRSIFLAWEPPDDPNGIIVNYFLYRNNSQVYSGTVRMFLDTDLSPYTYYMYYVVVFTMGGSTRSVDNLNVKTIMDTPSGVFPPQLTDIKQRSVVARWFYPTEPNGVIKEYVLNSLSKTGFHQHYKGLKRSYQVTGLNPFTLYSFFVSACNDVGCNQSPNSTISTRAAAPDSQPAPYATSLPGGNVVLVQWDPPAKPNGRVQFYDLYYHAVPKIGDDIVINALNPDVRNYTVTGLKPFTLYSFRVVCHTAQVKGSTASNWSEIWTLEGIPIGAASILPIAVTVNDSTIEIRWRRVTHPNGILIRHEVYIYLESTDYITPMPIFTTPGDVFYGYVRNLAPYALYQFTVKACNSIGCTKHSYKATNKTTAATPDRQAIPTGQYNDSHSITVLWQPPSAIHGPLQSLRYILERQLPSFSWPPPQVMAGVHFPGFGFYQLSSKLMPDSATTVLKFSFRTRFAGGLLFFAASKMQRDMVAVELREGLPWLIFDTESGAVAFTVMAEGARFDDNTWHYVSIWRERREGKIIIDNKYAGMGSIVGDKNIIGQISSVFVGGLPTNFKIIRQDDGRATLRRNHFIGCIKEFYLKLILIDFKTALDKEYVSPLSDHCPFLLIDGTYFQGGGYIQLKENVFKGGPRFKLSFRLKTSDANALLFLATAEETLLAVFIKERKLVFQYKTPTKDAIHSGFSLDLCDGNWHNVSVQCTGNRVSSFMDNKLQAIATLPIDFFTVFTYIGGIPRSIVRTGVLKYVLVAKGLHGCLRDLVIDHPVYFPHTLYKHHNVDFDGCAKYPRLSCADGNTDMIYNGSGLMYTDHHLKTYTAYLYRVKSYHQGIPGFGISPWVLLRSGEGAPQGMKRPTEEWIQGRSANLSWRRPTVSGGLLTKFILRAVPFDEAIMTREEEFSSDTFNGVVKHLQPAMKYFFQLIAQTSMGSVGSPGYNDSTTEAAPEGFGPPVVMKFPRALNVSWSAPTHPNGKILFYQVTLNNIPKYNGMSKYKFLDGLMIYTQYKLEVSACGLADCANNVLYVFTGQLPPTGVIAPQLQVLGTRRLQVIWTFPQQINGKLVKYEVYTSRSTSTEVMELSHTAPPTTFSATLGNLIPGSLYYVRVKAYTEAGGTLGDASHATTEESAPENIPTPNGTALSSSELYITILPPRKPNGIIISYTLYQDDIIVFQSPTAPANITTSDLAPYSKHVLQLKVCTARGCGLSDSIDAYTADSLPKGNITLNITILDSHTLASQWNRVANPHGLMTYTLSVHGEFYQQPGVDFLTENKTLDCYSGNITDETVICDKLLPYALYMVYVNGSNNAGYVLSNKIHLFTPAYLSVGVRAPYVVSIKSTSVYLSWQPPGRANGIVEDYILYLSFLDEDIEDAIIQRVQSGIFLQYNVSMLRPFWNYTFWLEVRNNIGVTVGEMRNITTLEGVPTDLDPPKIPGIDARWVLIHISPPVYPNGVIIHYTIYLNDSLVNKTLQTSAIVHHLLPYQSYSIYVGACTKIGCVHSSAVDFKTIQDVPEGVSPPFLLANSSRLVILRWIPPKFKNGIITTYKVQRRVNGSTVPTTIADTGTELFYIDETVKPYTIYQYRIVAETDAGGCPSPYEYIKTLEGAPEEFDSPLIKAISPSSISVNWNEPAIPNGVITHYIIACDGKEIHVDSVVFSHVVSNLRSYVVYSVTITSCNMGGCTETSPEAVRTLASLPTGQQPPTVEVLSNSSLRVRWSEPLYPNGPIVRYQLMGRVLESLIVQNISTPTPWLVVTEIVGTKYDHQRLGIFSLHQYVVVCVTTMGNTSSNHSAEYRTYAGIPVSGPTVFTHVLNHTSVKLSWFEPSIRSVKGRVLSFTVAYEVVSTGAYYKYAMYKPLIKSITVTGLRPDTLYDFIVTLSNGVGSKQSAPARATTLSGTPEGFDPPTISRVGADFLWIAWNPPRVPNGRINNYTIIANGVNMDTVDGLTTFYQQRRLRPYMVYIIKIQVCTQFSCTSSAGRPAKTNAAAPTNLSPPYLISNSSHSMDISWKPPRNENGIMLGYQLYQRSGYKCPVKPLPPTKCTYITCKISEQLCGYTCYDPLSKTCCGNRLYITDGRKTCCANSYTIKNLPTDVCCGGEFFPFQSSYQCCYGYYRQVSHGYICCSTDQSTIVGLGDACCGDIPYHLNGSKICLCGGLFEKYLSSERQCCGGQVVSRAKKCCGGVSHGIAYEYEQKKTCCGSRYVTLHNSLCCSDSVGNFKIRPKINNATGVLNKCCGANSIAVDQNCCNDRPYNSSSTCADKASDGTTDCGNGRVCPFTGKYDYFCNQCDFDPERNICYYVNGYYDKIHNNTANKTCHTNFTEILKNPKNPTLYHFKMKDLAPHTRYDYYLVAVNTEGSVSSPLSSARTMMAGPEGMIAPVSVPVTMKQIQVTWKKPLHPNGEITEYILYRVKWESKKIVLVYRGLLLSYLDDNGLEPYSAYMYILSACTSFCTNKTAAGLVYTKQDIPTGVVAPTLNPTSAYSMLVNWTAPKTPNGKITRYDVGILIDEKFKSVLPDGNLGNRMSQIVKKLKPYTEYKFKVRACTIIGCNGSEVSVERTLQAPPEGVKTPTYIVSNPRRVELSWDEPSTKNGVIVYYELRRNDTEIYIGMRKAFVDTSVEPASYYQYALRAATVGGYGQSEPFKLRTPESSPEGIQAPVLLATTFSSVDVKWTSPAKPNGLLISYSVLYQAKNGPMYKRYANLTFSKSITHLEPFTLYDFRIEACTKQGCGVGEKSDIRTLEAQPSGQIPPVLAAMINKIVVLSWKPPLKSNGIITKYKIQRQEVTIGTPMIVYFGTRMEYYDTHLKPYTLYQYKVVSYNNVGYAESDWATVRTLEDIPGEVKPPQVNVTSSSTVVVRWMPPGKLNGVLKFYEVQARKFQQVGNETVEKSGLPPDTLSVKISGFEAAVRYEFRVAAVNSAGRGVSDWTIADMKEAPPGTVPVLKYVTTYDINGNVDTLVISWDKPQVSNGAVTDYILYYNSDKIYEGLQRKAILPRIHPYTTYTFYLVVCNIAGCKAGKRQSLISGETMPSGQIPPKVGTTSDKSIELSWRPPLYPNGKIIMYQVILQELGKARRRRSNDHEVIVYSTNDTSKSLYSYTYTSMKAFTRYRFKIRAWNSQGNVDSEWVVITTKEAKPTGMSKVILSALPGPRVNILWQAPLYPNGVILYYSIYRNNSRIEGTKTMHHLDESPSLRPVTWYKYEVEACTHAGCTKSKPSIVVTLSGAPEDMLPPTLLALDSTTISVMWKAPINPNGKILTYKLYMNGGKYPIHSDYVFHYVKTGLAPFTEYSFAVSACTQQSCAKSKEAQIHTKESTPLHLPPPNLRVLGSRLIDIQWKPPALPNGRIRYYVLYRALALFNNVKFSGMVIYNGTDTYFLDQTVLPGSVYIYLVEAYNSAGHVQSRERRSSPTSPDAPQEVYPPDVYADSSSSIIVTWKLPGLPNGPITGYYVVYLNFERKASILLRKLRIEELEAYTWYEFRIRACTSAGCTYSGVNKTRTLEANPKEQSPPYFPSQHISKYSIKASWAPPQRPNGVILSYTLERRTSWSAPPQHVYSGPDISFIDSGNGIIIPGTEYHYRITSTNSVGNVSSIWAKVTTEISIPYVPTLTITEIRETGFSFKLPTTSKSHGLIIRTIIEIIDVGNVTNPPVPSINGLEPFSFYKVRLYMCNNAGCGVSAIKTVQTHGAQPQGFDQPVIVHKKSTSVAIRWIEPRRPNGVISRYSVHLTSTCYSSIQPDCKPYSREYNPGNGTSFEVVGLEPFSYYNITVKAFNEVASVTSPVISYRTRGDKPLLVGRVNVTVIREPFLETILLDWSRTFMLRSELLEYYVYENQVVVYTGTGLTLTRRNLKKGLYTYIVKVNTVVDQRTLSAMSNPESLRVGTGLFPHGDGSSGELWYQTVWFFALCALTIILLLFVFIVFGCMGYRKKRTVYVRQREPLPMKSKYGAHPTTPVDITGSLCSGAGSTYTSRGAINNPAASVHNEYIEVTPTKSVTIVESECCPDSEVHGITPNIPRRYPERTPPVPYHNEVPDSKPTGNKFIGWDGSAEDNYVTRDFDSGMSDDSPIHTERLDDIIVNGYTLQQDRVLFPDTHL